ncbi:response regulator [Methylophaga sp.]|jgi:DNA-binding response OmpR family regulator|uniref:response regulator transcription factor n=1 Tax=Methylophaga sp. TaxID=2024840 RepID=UPI0013FEEC70|nr:response regulator [Methylophaga sp.]MTI63449.1 response regulator [Methylophaga sp.]
MAEKQKLLIVDDHDTLRELLKMTLEFSDFELFEATDANEALSMVAEIEPDVIILDIMMPGEMDGVDVCRRLKANPKTAHIKIILLSAKGQAEDIRVGGEAGADAYFVKPFSPMSLLESIKVERYRDS